MTEVVVRWMRLEGFPGDLPRPERQTAGSAGYDVACAEESVVLGCGEIRMIETGWAMALPAGVECQIRPRSGLALKHGITLPNSPATIDSDYRGPLRVILQNLGAAPFTIRRGDRIAQLVFSRFEVPTMLETDQLESTDRGHGGFGSTGR